MKIPLIHKKPKFVEPKYLSTMPIPTALHGKNPRKILGKEWWDKERFAAKRLNNRCCYTCGIHEDSVKWLEGHEVYRYNYWKKQATYIKTISVCPTCHKFIHIGRSNVMCRGDIKNILRHGIKILDKHNIALPPITAELARCNNIDITGCTTKSWPKCSTSGKWRLVIYGKEYTF